MKATYLPIVTEHVSETARDTTVENTKHTVPWMVNESRGYTEILNNDRNQRIRANDRKATDAA